MIAAIPSAVLIGVDGYLVSVEVHVSNGLPGFTVVGLPDAAVRESRDRVRAALLSSGLPWPLRRVTVNLAPSGMRKNGAGLDLPIAIGLLVASGELEPKAVASTAFIGELGLDGSLRGVPGTVVLAESLRHYRLVVPDETAVEAGLAIGSDVRTASTLGHLVDHLAGRVPWSDAPQPQQHVPRFRLVDPLAGDAEGPESAGVAGGMAGADLSDLRGQTFARRPSRWPRRVDTTC
jgi:magnesium chelatase family protein